MTTRIVLADNEPIGVALRRFKKLLERNGVTWEMREHLYFVKETEMRRAKKYRKWHKARIATLRAKHAGQRAT